MTVNGWLQVALFCAIVIALVKPLGRYMTRVMAGERTILSPVLRPVERLLYAGAGVDERQEQHWLTYMVAMLAFNAAGFLALFGLQRLQGVLPLNPMQMGAVSPDSAFNTAVSLVTNTNWQGYGGETIMGYLVQMAGLTVQIFVSAATGVAIAMALIRGFARASAKMVGNFWADLTRATLYVLLPLSILCALFYVSQGVTQTLRASIEATTLEGAKQIIAVGPTASQLAIKMLGTNGGGFFNANSAHPFENPTVLTNLIEMVSIFAIGAALTNVFGRMVGDALRRTRTETDAKRLVADSSTYEVVPATSLKIGDIVVVEIGDTIPSDGEVIEGIASVNEAAITGESAPVIRESGGDRSAVTGGTQVLSDQIKVRITATAGSTFLDRMISLVEGAQRQKTPNEIALNILLAGMTLIFVLAVVTIPSFAHYAGGAIPVVSLVALFVTLIPTALGALLSAIGIAGMDRLVRFNVLAMSGRAVEAAGDVDTLLLDKTGTITLGNRQATEFLPLAGVSERELADAAQLSSLADETPEGRSIVVRVKEKYGIRGREMEKLHAHFVPFTAQTRMSGVDLDGTSIRKGAVDAMLADAGTYSSETVRELRQIAETVGKSGGTPLAVARDGRLLGVVHLKNIVKGGIRTVMITGDNPMTAAAIAAEAGVDDFLAQATPENKLELIRGEQAKGKLVAMCGDGTNDAPALAQADVGVAMNTGTVAAREAGNMVDLDSDPTKLIEVVEIGKQLLMTRGSLTTFSIANDVAKYFAIIPAMFVAFYPQLQALKIMRLSSPESAILSAIIFNALVIIALIPLALKGVKYRAIGAAALLRRNLLIYGLGGMIVPFIGIKAIDLVITAVSLA